MIHSSPRWLYLYRYWITVASLWIFSWTNPRRKLHILHRSLRTSPVWWLWSILATMPFLIPRGKHCAIFSFMYIFVHDWTIPSHHVSRKRDFSMSIDLLSAKSCPNLLQSRNNWSVVCCQPCCCCIKCNKPNVVNFFQWSEMCAQFIKIEVMWRQQY